MTVNRIDAVLPLLLRDLDRFEILDKSLRKNFLALNICWVITTDSEYAEMKKRIEGDIYHCIPEGKIIPELKFYTFLHKILFRKIFIGKLIHRIRKRKLVVAGWYVQQLIKLAIADKVETDFYLTLDADVICLRPTIYDDIVQNDKAIVNTTEGDWHPKYYENAEQVLGLPRSGLTHGVTPAVLNKKAVFELRDYLDTRVNVALRFFSILCPHELLRNIMISWASFLVRNGPWTEYSLYYTFLEATGKFDKYHVRRGPNALLDIYASLWLPEYISSWSLQKFTKDEASFIVAQSNTKIPVEQVWQKVRKYIE